MTSAGNSRILRTILLTILIFSLSSPSQAKYSGGTGKPNYPYQIATAEDLMLPANICTVKFDPRLSQTAFQGKTTEIL